MALTSKQDTFAICIVFPALALIMITLRFWIRKRRNAPWKADDYLCIPAWICCAGYFILLAGASGVEWDPEIFKYATKGHATPAVKAYSRISNALSLLWAPANAFIKLSTIFFYRRIFIGTGRTFRYLSASLIFFVIVWVVYAVMADIFFCGTYFKANFDGEDEPKCGDLFWNLDMALFVSDCFCDICILILPIPFIKDLNLQRRQKVMLVLVFATGSMAIVGSLNVTIVTILNQTIDHGRIEGVPSNNGVLLDILTWNWQALEIGFGLIASNIAVLKPVWGEIVPSHVQRWASTGFVKLRNELPHGHSRLRSKSKSSQSSWRLWNQTEKSHLPQTTTQNRPNVEQPKRLFFRQSIAPQIPQINVNKSLGLSHVFRGRREEERIPTQDVERLSRTGAEEE